MMIGTRIFEGSELYYCMVIDCGEIQLHVLVHKCSSRDRKNTCAMEFRSMMDILFHYQKTKF